MPFFCGGRHNNKETTFWLRGTTIALRAFTANITHATDTTVEMAAYIK